MIQAAQLGHVMEKNGDDLKVISKTHNVAEYEGEEEASEIRVWLVDSHSDYAERLRAEWGQVLCPPELERARVFRFESDRVVFMITRILVRLVVGSALGIAPDKLEFVNDSYGRPEVSGTVKLSFNVSHSEGLITLAVAEKGNVGIDVESVNVNPLALDAACSLLAPQEFLALQDAPDHKRAELFTQFWVLKEAHLKALGIGLSRGTLGVSFSLGKSGIILLCPSETHPRLESSCFQIYDVGGTHQLCICTVGYKRPPAVLFYQGADLLRQITDFQTQPDTQSVLRA